MRKYILQPIIVLFFLLKLSFVTYAQCNGNLWQARSLSTINGGCTSAWQSASTFVSNGVLQMPGDSTCEPTYYYTEFEMSGSLCISKNFSYEVRLRNLNPTTYNMSAYDVYLKVFNTANIPTGVALMDANPLYNWAQPYTNLYAGSSSVGNLASLRPDLNNWTTVRLQYVNNVLTCFIDGVQAAQVSYSGDICNISGLNVIFKSSGELDWVRMLDASGNEVWREDFYNPATPGCFTPFPACSPTLSPSYIAPCSGSVLNLYANPGQSFSSYSWTGPNGFTSTQQNPAISNPTLAAGGTYTVTAQLNNCMSPVVATVNVCGCTGKVLLQARENKEAKPHIATPGETRTETTIKAKILSVNPNPFVRSTTVSYSIPENITKAEIRLMTTGGSVLKTVAVPKSEKGSLTISGLPVLTGGSYLFVLVTDGKVADSKVVIAEN